MTRNNVDLNRDFPDRFSKPPSLMPTGSEQAEVQALMDWSRRIGFTASAAMHEVGMQGLMDGGFEQQGWV